MKYTIKYKLLDLDLDAITAQGAIKAAGGTITAFSLGGQPDAVTLQKELQRWPSTLKSSGGCIGEKSRDESVQPPTYACAKIFPNKR